MTRVIETDRLVLRPPENGDAPAIARLIGNFEVSKWLTVVPHPYTLADGEAFVREIAGPWDRVITRTGEVIGVVGIKDSLGYWLGQPFWGQGFMSEAAGALVAEWFAFAPTDEHRTEGSTRPRVGEKRPPSRWQRASGTTGAAGRCPALPPGGTDGMGTLKSTHLTSGYFTENTASANVLTKLGFTPDGSEMVHARALDRQMELQRMVLTRAAWEARHG